MSDQMYVLVEYQWIPARVVKENKTTFLLEYTYPFCKSETKRIKKEKCARPDEQVCVVWETWRGVNGRGGYRVERELYPQYRIPASQISRQHNFFGINTGRIKESAYGVKV